MALSREAQGRTVNPAIDWDQYWAALLVRLAWPPLSGDVFTPRAHGSICMRKLAGSRPSAIALPIDSHKYGRMIGFKIRPLESPWRKDDALDAAQYAKGPREP